jgi:hypothetical protein
VIADPTPRCNRGASERFLQSLTPKPLAPNPWPLFMQTPWENELARFMTDLLAVQDDTLHVLVRKRELLGASDGEGLAMLGVEEARIVDRLQECLRRREEMLGRAAREGLPADSIQSLTKALPKSRRGELPKQLRLSKAQSRLLQNHSLTNWVIAQKTLIHLSQVLEIIATGGRLKPTYERGEPATVGSGALVDHEA